MECQNCSIKKRRIFATFYLFSQQYLLDAYYIYAVNVWGAWYIGGGGKHTKIPAFKELTFSKKESDNKQI